MTCWMRWTVTGRRCVRWSFRRGITGHAITRQAIGSARGGHAIAWPPLASSATSAKWRHPCPTPETRSHRFAYGQSPLLLLTEGKGCILISVTERETRLSKPNDLVQGTLDLLILKMLALEPMNGWSIGLRLKQLSSDVLQVSDGSLYPALHKLEQEGWVTAEWRQTENNRRAKFYSLTRAGTKQLQIETGNWDRLAQAITAVVRLREA